MIRPWSTTPIKECGESLERIPLNFYRLEPHPYFALGAPYGTNADPWYLRVELIRRLNHVKETLAASHPFLQIALFDAWRPIAVQSFMINFAIRQECSSRGISYSIENKSIEMKQIITDVEKFWAQPSQNKDMPPPHSTGAAIDLTFANLDGELIDMGSPIDAIGDISHPSYFSDQSKSNQPSALIFHQRRSLLAEVMVNSGFVQHPNEWWHFSYGDQLWAWKTKSAIAFYGSCNPSESISSTACSPT